MQFTCSFAPERWPQHSAAIDASTQQAMRWQLFMLMAQLEIELQEDAKPSTGRVFATFERLILVFECIAKDGPLTIKEMNQKLPFSRGAIVRATSVLKQKGWVRTRFGDGAFEVSSRLDQFLASGHIAPPEAEEFGELIDTVLAHGQMHVLAGMFEHRGVFRLVDGSIRRRSYATALSLVFDDLALVAQSVMTSADLEANLGKYIQDMATTEEVQAIQTGEHVQYLQQISNDGLIWSQDDDAVSVPVLCSTGAIGAVKFEMKPGYATNSIVLKQLATRLRHEVPAGDTCLPLKQISEIVKLTFEFDTPCVDSRDG